MHTYMDRGFSEKGGSVKRYQFIVIGLALTLACRSSNQVARMKTENKQERTQIIQKTQPVLTHVENFVGNLNVEKVKAVNSEFIQSIEPEITEDTLGEPRPRVAENAEQQVVEESRPEISPILKEQTDMVYSQYHKILGKPEIAVTGGPQGRMIEEAESKETREAAKTNMIEAPQPKAAGESQFIVFVGSEPEMETGNEYGPFIVDIDRDAPWVIAQEPKTVISTIRKIVGISHAQESPESGTKFIEVSEAESKEKLDRPKTDMVKER